MMIIYIHDCINAKTKQKYRKYVYVDRYLASMHKEYYYYIRHLLNKTTNDEYIFDYVGFAL